MQALKNLGKYKALLIPVIVILLLGTTTSAAIIISKLNYEKIPEPKEFSADLVTEKIVEPLGEVAGEQDSQPVPEVRQTSTPQTTAEQTRPEPEPQPEPTSQPTPEPVKPTPEETVRINAANDSKRKSDVANILKAIATYKSRVGKLPTYGRGQSPLPVVSTRTLIQFGANATSLNGVAPTYIATIPVDPTGVEYKVGTDAKGVTVIVGILLSDGSLYYATI